jgi:glutaconyl-CoA/methylmalonyl-CoA decarboxylase subunit delta
MNAFIILQAQAQTAQAHESADKFAELDPIGIGMTMIAMAVVFSSLLMLYLVFKNVARIYSMDLRKKALLKKGRVEEAEKIKQDTTADLGAAIGLALHLYKSELHDHENTLLTIKKVGRTYTPWSSKIYGLRKSPR